MAGCFVGQLEGEKKSNSGHGGQVVAACWKKNSSSPHRRALPVTQALAEIRTQLAHLETCVQDCLTLVRTSQMERNVARPRGGPSTCGRSESQPLAHVARNVILRLEGLEDLGAIAFHPEHPRPRPPRPRPECHERHAVGDATLAGQRTATYVTIQVRDTGHDISTRQLTHIFEPLYTTKPGGPGCASTLCRRLWPRMGDR